VLGCWLTRSGTRFLSVGSTKHGPDRVRTRWEEALLTVSPRGTHVMCVGLSAGLPLCHPVLVPHSISISSTEISGFTPGDSSVQARGRRAWRRKARSSTERAAREVAGSSAEGAPHERVAEGAPRERAPGSWRTASCARGRRASSADGGPILYLLAPYRRHAINPPTCKP
jgi:hypothetical protein